MKYTVVAFTARNDTLLFYNIIKKNGNYSAIINTPRSIARSCGMSVKITNGSVNFARQILASGRFPTFFGIYEISIANGKETPTKIY